MVALFNATVILIVLAICFLAITLFALVSMFIMRGREQNREEVRAVEDVVAELDKSLDAAITEINKMGALVQKDITDKHNEILFLYNLILDKHKEIENVKDGDIISEMVEQYLQTHSAQLQLLAEENAILNSTPEIIEVEVEEVKKERKRPVFTNPKHEEIWNRRELGQTNAEIAKDMNIGQGEVKLILDLADRAS